MIRTILLLGVAIASLVTGWFAHTVVVPAELTVVDTIIVDSFSVEMLTLSEDALEIIDWESSNTLDSVWMWDSAYFVGTDSVWDKTRLEEWLKTDTGELDDVALYFKARAIHQLSDSTISWYWRSDRLFYFQPTDKDGK